MNKPERLCIGHRGAMGYAPENTLASIRKALELGTPCIEVDVYSVDAHLVVFHDTRIDRMTNAEGYLTEQSFDYLRSLDVGDDETIPTLEEVCDALADDTCLNIELKGPDTAEPVVALIKKYVSLGWNKNRFLVSSFNHRELSEVNRRDAEIKTGALIRGLPVDDARFAEELNAFSVNLAMDFVDQRFVDDAHMRGLKVYVYTANHPEDIDRMQRLGVDGVFSSYPDRVLAAYQQPDMSAGWT